VTAVEELESILTAELAAHERLLDLKRRERDRLAGGSPGELLEVVAAIGEAAAEIESLETLRAAACRVLARDYELPELDPALRDIVARVPACSTPRWNRLQDQLREVLARIQRVNRESRYLARGSLAWVAGLLATVSGGNPQSAAYDGRGAGTETGSRPLLVNRTA